MKPPLPQRHYSRLHLSDFRDYRRLVVDNMHDVIVISIMIRPVLPAIVNNMARAYSQPDHPRTLADRALSRLQDDIVRGAIAPGTKVSEAMLAERYGVSRGPMREVIRRLEARKLLERTVHVGTRVVRLDIEALSDLYYVREALEGMAARRAAKTMSRDEIDGLDALLADHEQQQDIREDVAYFQREGDLDFHYRIIEGSHNPALIETLINELYYRIRMSRYQFSGVEKRPRQALKEHRAIVEAIAAGDGELAEMLMRRHISRARRNIESRGPG